MQINIDNPVITVIALWGAILSTIVLAWDIFKWKTAGPKLRVSVKPKNEKIESLSKQGFLMCALYHSHSDKPIKKRLVINKKK